MTRPYAAGRALGRRVEPAAAWRVENPTAESCLTGTMVGMTFEDLPPDIRSLPLTDPRLAADVIDLIISDRDRAGGCVGIMVCDAEHRGVLPIVLSEASEDARVTDFARLLELLLPLVVEQRGSLVIGRGHPRGHRPTDGDRAWHQQAIDSCRAEGVRLLGFHLATP